MKYQRETLEYYNYGSKYNFSTFFSFIAALLESLLSFMNSIYIKVFPGSECCLYVKNHILEGPLQFNLSYHSALLCLPLNDKILHPHLTTVGRGV